MSYKLMALIHDMIGLNVVPKAVLMALASYAKDDGSGCFAGQASIAQRAGCGERTARKYLAFLEGKGLIKRAHRQRKDGSRTSDDHELSVHAIETYRHRVPDGRGACDDLSNRHGRSIQPAQNVDPTGAQGQSNRQGVPDKNLSVESVSESIRRIGQSLDHPPSILPPEGGASRDSTGAAVAGAPSTSEELKFPKPEPKTPEQFEAERQRQLRLVRERIVANQSVGNPNTDGVVITGNFSRPKPALRSTPNEFDRSKAAYQRKAEKRAAAAARRAATGGSQK
jgi:hypothetical protein